MRSSRGLIEMSKIFEKIRPALKCVLFIAGLMLIVRLLDYGLAKEGYVNYILHNVNSDDTDYDTVIVGASHGRAGIDPEILDSVMETDTINMSIPGETVKDNYYVVKESCRNNNVKTVILDVDFQYWIGEFNEGADVETFIYNGLGWDSPNKWEYLIRNADHINAFYGISHKLTYTDKSDEIKENVRSRKDKGRYKKGYKPKSQDGDVVCVNSGFFYMNNTTGELGGKEIVEEWIGKEKEAVQGYVVEYFEDLLAYCKENDIELICVTSPITPSTLKMLDYESIATTLENFFGSYGVDYYDFNKCRLSILPRTDDDFLDQEGHMSGEIATDYSKILASMLKKRSAGTLSMNYYFYSTYDEMYQNLEVK